MAKVLAEGSDQSKRVQDLRDEANARIQDVHHEHDALRLDVLDKLDKIDRKLDQQGDAIRDMGKDVAVLCFKAGCKRR